jgi:hypothetical protein
MSEYICRRCWATVECICSGYEPPWPLNLSANLAAAGMATVLHRLLVRSCMNGDCDCSSGRMQRTMREAVS